MPANSHVGVGQFLSRRTQADTDQYLIGVTFQWVAFELDCSDNLYILPPKPPEMVLQQDQIIRVGDWANPNIPQLYSVIGKNYL